MVIDAFNGVVVQVELYQMAQLAERGRSHLFEAVQREIDFYKAIVAVDEEIVAKAFDFVHAQVQGHEIL